MSDNFVASDIFLHKYLELPYNEQEILRYSGCKDAEPGSEVYDLMTRCIDEVKASKACTYAICYRMIQIHSMDEEYIDFGITTASSKDLAKCLSGCNKAVFMAATIGHEIDRIIYRYEKLEPSKAVFMQAIGAERVETMLNAFCDEFGKIYSEDFGSNLIDDIELTPRFSPGYGDLPLAMQSDFMGILDMSRKLGITLNDSLLMSPSKSVTAIAGIK